MRTENYTVCGSETIRLDKYLSDQLIDLSRVRIQDLIRNGNVLVNGNQVKSSYRVCDGDEIHVDIIAVEQEPDHIIPEQMDLDIIYEDEDLAAVNKPAGLVVHPGKNNPQGTLANGLAHHFNNLSDINGVLRPGIVHRLDKDTSGIILVAKKNSSHMALAKQFEQRQVKKTYLGLTWGEWQPDSGKIEMGIRRNRADATKFMAAEDGRTAVTEFRLIEHLRHLSYVQFHPVTGRTHQIRVHAAHAGFAIFADEVYNGGRNRTNGYLPEVKKILISWLKTIDRHALHAHKIMFTHPASNRLMEFVTPLPADMSIILDKSRVFNG